MSSGYQIGNLEPDYGRVTTEDEIRRRIECKARRAAACAHEASGYSLCSDQPAQLEMPAALLPAAQAMIREGLDAAPVASVDTKNVATDRALRQLKEITMILQIIIILLVILGVCSIGVYIENSWTSASRTGGSYHSHGKYCSECGGLI